MVDDDDDDHDDGGGGGGSGGGKQLAKAKTPKTPIYLSRAFSA